MSLHISRFIDSLKAHESRGQRDFGMTMRDAKDLHADITKLLLTLHTLQEKTMADSAAIKVEVTGGTFKNP